MGKGRTSAYAALTGAMLLALAAPARAGDAAGVTADVTAAIAATDRREAENVALDASRKPAELLRFMGLHRGMAVLDMVGANLYWSEIIAPALGETGQLTIWQPTQFLPDKTRQRVAAFTAGQPRTMMLASPFGDPKLGREAYDFILLHLDYHDVYWQSEKYKIARMEPDPWLKRVYEAARPGATIAVIDHVGPAGDTRAIVETLHRIDPAVVRADFERAGFVFEAASDLYANPADDHQVNVFDKAIRGRTDRFAFRFRKPR